MRRKNLLYILAGFSVVAISVGITISQFFYPIGAQSVKQSPPKDLTAEKKIPVVWQRTEISLDLSGSKLTIDLNSISPAKDWILGVKSVANDGKEKMYAGIVTWEESSEKMKGFLRASKIENLPQNTINFKSGSVQFSDVLEQNQSLVLYIEKKAATQLVLEHGGLTQELNSSDQSFSIFDGVTTATKIDGPSSLLNELHMQKVRKELETSGASVTFNGSKEKK